MLNLLAFTDPPTPEEWFYPLVWPIVFCGLGLYFYFKGARQAQFGSEYKPQRFALPICGLGLILGLYTLSHMTDYLYREAVLDSGKRVLASHIGGPILAALSFAAILGHKFVTRDQDDDFARRRR